ncbi:MAG: hypothetical protein ACE5GT_06175 [Rhodospirillales bacterium]
MAKNRRPATPRSPVPAGKRDPGRAERLAQALRGNLAKRKRQARARKKGPGGD